MAMTKSQLIEEFMKLEPEDRDEVADAIMLQRPSLTPEQIAELHRRVEALDRGDVEPLPGEEVMRELRERYSPQRP